MLAENIQLNPEFNLDVTFTEPNMDIVFWKSDICIFMHPESYQVIIMFCVGHHPAAPISCRVQIPHFKRVFVPDMVSAAWVRLSCIHPI